MLTYREPAWPEDRSCLIRIGSYELSAELDTSAEAIEAYILDEVERVHAALSEYDEYTGK